MRQRNDGQGEENALQNKFTAYLLTALKRKKHDYMVKQMRLNRHERPIGFQTTQFPDGAEGIGDRPEYPALIRALNQLTARERYILFERVLNDIEYSELADRLNLRYSGISTAYHRVIQKLRKALQEDCK